MLNGNISGNATAAIEPGASIHKITSESVLYFVQFLRSAYRKPLKISDV